MAAFEEIRVSGQAELDFEKMPGIDRRNFIADTFDAIDRFFSNPANAAKFEEWKRRRSKNL